MDIFELFEHAKALPAEPGVYIMYDISGMIIYIGKAVKLCNRVSQYFTNITSHNIKVYQMVTHVDHFEFILTRSELEALILECRLIKEHKPKYNILLKDDKSYPFIAINMSNRYPVLRLEARKKEDQLTYFGPFGGRYLTQKLIDTLNHSLHLPTCGKQLPLKKENARTCLNYHLKICDGWCCGKNTEDEYRSRVRAAEMILNGKYGDLERELTMQMESAAAMLNFELAAELRDRIQNLSVLKEQQMISSNRFIDIDAIGISIQDSGACLSILHYINGTLLDKDLILPEYTFDYSDIPELIIQYYSGSDNYPAQILFSDDFEEFKIIQDYFKHICSSAVLSVPKRGDLRRFADIARKNSEEELLLHSPAPKQNTVLKLLSEKLNLSPLYRIESYDISHISGTDIVASMVVYEGSSLNKKEYRHFKLNGMKNQDDYYALKQVLERRLSNLKAGASGFQNKPDLLLIDGGPEQAAVAENVLANLELQIAVCGMVKDDRHRTRALVYADGREISISGNPSVFSLIGQIQEETHRFAITYHRKLRGKRMTASALDQISGIGPKRKEILLKRFGSVSAIEKADLDGLKTVLSDSAAESVYHYFHKETTQCESSPALQGAST